MFVIHGLWDIVTMKDAEVQAIPTKEDAQIAELETRLVALEKLVIQAATDGKGGVR